MELKGKTAIVTGSGRGIGEGIAIAFAREGANVVVMERNADNAAAVVEKIASQGGSAVAFKADVTKVAEVDAMVARTLEKFGRLDILVNNAGIQGPPTLVQDLSEDQWERVLAVNLKGVFLCARAVVPAMIRQNKGKIINIASTAALRMTFFGSVEYTVSKHGVAGLTHHLAWELADHKINVNAICPGGVSTPLMERDTTSAFRDTLSKRLVPLGRLCTPDEIGQAAVFLASDRSDMITGQLLSVDGGLLTGFGEDLRPEVRKRMKAAEEPHAA